VLDSNPGFAENLNLREGSKVAFRIEKYGASFFQDEP